MSKSLTSLSVVTFNDLQAFGIQALTGEACEYHQRILCDISAQGKELLKSYLGLVDLELDEPQNSFVGDGPAIGSMMLSRAVLSSIGSFALMYHGALAVIHHNDGVVQGLSDSAYLQAYEQAGYCAVKHNLATWPSYA